MFVPPERIAAAGFLCQLQSSSRNNWAAGETATAITPGIEGTCPSGEGAINAAAVAAVKRDFDPPALRRLESDEEDEVVLSQLF